MDKFSFLNAIHPSQIAELYEKYLQYPDSVEPSWRAFFQGFDFGSENTAQEFFGTTEPAEPEDYDVGAICADVIKELMVTGPVGIYLPKQTQCGSAENIRLPWQSRILAFHSTT